MKKTKGFTLVELIIVIAVIGVLAAILIPVFSNVIEKANRKSALSDARNAVTSYIAEIEGSRTYVPDAIAVVRKGNKAYVFIYSGSSEGMMDITDEPYSYTNRASIADFGEYVVSELETGSVISVNPDAADLPDPNALLMSQGYDTDDGIYLNIEYTVDMDAVDAMTGGEIDAASMPEPTPRIPTPVRYSSYDETDCIYTYNITASNIERNIAIPNDNDTDTIFGVALDFSEIIEKCANNMVGTNWYGYDIRIVNNTGRNIVISKTVINVSGSASGFVCSFIGQDDEGGTSFADFRNAVSGNSYDTSYVTLHTLTQGDNEITDMPFTILTPGSHDLSGAFMLGYTGGATPPNDARDIIAVSTVTMYMKRT